MTFKPFSSSFHAPKETVRYYYHNGTVGGWVKKKLLGGPLAAEDRKNLKTSFACSASMTTVPAAVSAPVARRARPSNVHHDTRTVTRRGRLHATCMYIHYVKPYGRWARVRSQVLLDIVLPARVPRPRNEDGDDRLTRVSSQANLISGGRFCNNNNKNNNNNSYNGNNNWPPMTSYLFEIKTDRARPFARATPVVGNGGFL